MKQVPYISVVIPVFDETSNLETLIERCLTTLKALPETFELILVDDGSKDNSAEMIVAATKENPEIIAVLLNRNYGQHAAILAGFSKARGQIIITLDADLQNPPEEMAQLYLKVKEGHDVVGSVRERRQDSLFRRGASAIVNKAVRKSTGISMHDYGCMLRAYERHVVEAVLQCSEKTTFIPVLANSFARNPTEVLVAHDKRQSGNSKYSLLKLISLQFDLLTSMTTFPLRLLSILGGLSALSGFLFAAFLLIMRLTMGSDWAVDGVFTLFAIAFVFLGIQLMGLGLLGEYIGRIFKEVKRRPAFTISRVVSHEDRQVMGPQILHRVN